VRDWLFNEDSLTRRLTALSHQGFSVTPLQEGWQPLRSDECSALGVPPGSQGWVREVYLRGHAQPWVFARSVAARSALQGSGLNLAELGSRSLGELLFSDRAFDRGAMQVCRYPAAWLPTEARAERLWGRRSCFSRGALGVLVAEVFLPAFWVAADIEP
jgi:chorismate--pyruvate lyase